MNRRDFLVNSCGACLAMTGIATALPACNTTRYLSGNLGADGITISKSDFLTGRKGKTTHRSFVIVRNEALQYPIFVYRFGEDEYSALWMRCTHQGSELHASGDSLQCPAHGSEFNNRGKMTNGPADADLKNFPVSITNDQLFIDLRKKMKHLTIFLLTLLSLAPDSYAQIDPSLLRRVPRDTSRQQLNMDATYNRPFIQIGKLPVALGGYVEANYQYMNEDGITEGHQFQMRRLTLFVSSSISKRIKFLTEIEFEDGTKEINIEFASIDFEFAPLLNFRGGVVMNPIGAFNQNHDGPKWEFVDRPISATQMLPATWSNVGFGLFGKRSTKDWVYGYEVYLTNGFNDKIITNSENKTFLPASKQDADRFEESFNGVPLFTGKVALRNNKIGELGLSYMGGVYNKFEEDGLTLDEKRRVKVYAIDFNTTIPKANTYINAEWAWVNVDIPDTYTEQFGRRQQGGFIDFVQPVLKRNILGFERAVLNVALRLEYTDWNKGKFKSTGDSIGDDVYSIVPAISFRPTPLTVLRFNYRHNWQKDILGNPPSKLAGFQFGISSYF